MLSYGSVGFPKKDTLPNKDTLLKWITHKVGCRKVFSALYSIQTNVTEFLSFVYNDITYRAETHRWAEPFPLSSHISICLWLLAIRPGEDFPFLFASPPSTV